MVVLMSSWPSISWAMCGGMPVRMASVVKTLLKSWGQNARGLPSVPVMPEAARAPLRRPRIPAVGIGRFSRAMTPLEQQRRRRVPDALVGVVGGDERDGAASAADPGDDRGQDVGQFRADDEEPFGVGLGRRDRQQRDQLAG
jgi:hypothetical protein